MYFKHRAIEMSISYLEVSTRDSNLEPLVVTATELRGGLSRTVDADRQLLIELSDPCLASD